MMAEKINAGLTVWSKRLGLIILGWLACSAYYGTLNLTKKADTLQHVQTVELPKIKAEAKCEHSRADKTAVVAEKAIVSASSDTVPIPQPKDIPADCPHPK